MARVLVRPDRQIARTSHRYDPRVQFGILGPLEVAEDGRAIPVPGAKLRALLCLLVLDAGRVVPAERLIEGVWGDDLPANPANALQARVSQLRRLFGSERIQSRPSGYLLVAGSDDIDASRFETLAAQGRAALASGDARQAATIMTEALALWRGSPLGELADTELGRTEAVRLGELRLSIIEDRTEAELNLGRHAELVSELQAVVAEHPLRERLRGQLMVALYRSGRQAEALRAYQQGRTTLVDELGIDPGPALQQLEAAILTQDPVLDLPDGHGVEQLVGTTGAAGASSASRPNGASPRRPAARPAIGGSLSNFVGRRDELVQVTKLMGQARLVTITGPGGAGKTRLAVEVGTKLQPAVPDGVWLVELAPISDPASLAWTVAEALGVRDAAAFVRAGQGTQGLPPADERLAEYLGGKSPVLLLDNCEHVVTAVAELVVTLLARCPELRVLATSREPLGVPGELQWAIPPLSSPGKGASEAEVATSEAVLLFAQRAAAVQPSFVLQPEMASTVADICRRLDGLPLAIELAAARVKVMPVAQIAERLDNRFHLLTGGMRTALPRHRTLRALVDWSYDLLTEPERIGFGQLSVFAGGCGLEAAEHVCGDAGIDEGEVIDVVAHLVDKSLVVAGSGIDGTARYRMLETLRQYGLETLAARGQATEARQRHLRWCLALAEEAEPQMRGPGQRQWLDRLEADQDNFRAALDWTIGRGDTESALRLGSCLAWFWWVRGRQREGRAWLENALASRGPADRRFRVNALSWAGYLATDHDLEQAISWGAEAVAASADVAPAIRARAQLRLATSLVRALDHDRLAQLVAEAIPPLERDGDDWWIGWAYNVASFDALFRGDLEAAAAACRQSLARFEASGSNWGKGRTLHKLAIIAELRGDDKTASALYYDSLGFARSLGLDEVVAVMLVQLAAVVARDGDAKQAEELRAESRALVRALARIESDPTGASGPGRIARRRSDLARADGLFVESLAWYRQAGVTNGAAASLLGLGFLAERRDDHAEAARRYREALDVSVAADDISTIASAADGLARVGIATGDHAWGATLLGGLQRLRTSAASPRARSEQVDVDEAIVIAQASLGASGLGAAWAAGESLTASGVIAMALAESGPAPESG
jgi:predicted ATPase/DNA-binding SARP family transcriptional activator